MRFVNNANSIIEDMLRRDNVVGAYKQLLTATQHSYRHSFVSSLQIYVTKLGIILSQCSIEAKIKNKTYLGSIDYICNGILKNKSLYSVMRAIGINDSGNTMKHNINDIEIDIDLTIKNYNNLISEIIKTTKFGAFKKCYLNKEKNARDIPIADDPKHHKYFMLNNIKFQLKISPDYKVDPYSKVLFSKITLYWPDSNPKHYIDIRIINTKTNRIMGSCEKLDISSANSKRAIELKCSEADLDRRVLYLSAEITLYKKVSECYTTGALFWKKTHFYDSYERIGSRTEKISQLFRAN